MGLGDERADGGYRPVIDISAMETAAREREQRHPIRGKLSGDMNYPYLVYLTENYLPSRGDGVLPNRALVAQAYATLALAEQQRLANLLAWFSLTGEKPTSEQVEMIQKGLNL